MPLLFKSRCDLTITVIKTPTIFEDGNSVLPKKTLRKNMSGLHRRVTAPQTSGKEGTPVLRVPGTVDVPTASPESTPGASPARACLEAVYGSHSSWE